MFNLCRAKEYNITKNIHKAFPKMFDWIRNDGKENKSEGGCFVLVNKMYKDKIRTLRAKLSKKMS